MINEHAGALRARRRAPNAPARHRLTADLGMKSIDFAELASLARHLHGWN